MKIINQIKSYLQKIFKISVPFRYQEKYFWAVTGVTQNGTTITVYNSANSKEEAESQAQEMFPDVLNWNTIKEEKH